MNISEEGLRFIKQSEALRLEAYQDAVGIWTLGYGHIAGVHEGDSITEEQAEIFLRADLQTVEKCISNSVSVELTQGQYDALCSFVFNLGCVALRNSTLLRKLNAGDDVGAAEEFHRWSHAGGKELPGLIARREKEKEMFLA